MAELAIRVGSAADIDAAAEVWRVSNSARRGVPDIGAEEVARVRDRLESPDGWFLVAEQDGSMVGMAFGTHARARDGAGEVIPGLCHLSLVFVAPDRWGRGIGGEIVDAALDEARRRGHDRIQLWTHEANERAQRLYRGRGFVPSGRTMIDYRGELIGHWVREL